VSALSESCLLRFAPLGGLRSYLNRDKLHFGTVEDLCYCSKVTELLEILWRIELQG
jgi:hypothetical protein